MSFLVIFSFKDLWSKGFLKAPSVVSQLLLLQVVAVKKHRCSFPRIPLYPLPSISNWVAKHTVDILSEPFLGLVLVCYWFACVAIPKNQLGFVHCRPMDQQEIMDCCNARSSCLCLLNLSPLKPAVCFSAAGAQGLGWWIRLPCYLKERFQWLMFRCKGHWGWNENPGNNMECSQVYFSVRLTGVFNFLRN